MDLIEQLVAEPRRRDAQTLCNGAKKLHRREPRIDEQHHRTRLPDAIDERAGERRLPGADVADEQRQFLLVDGVLEPRQRLAMLIAFEEERRIGSLPEGLGAEAEELFEH